MNDNDILQSLENLCRDLALDLRYEKGDFFGGLFRYRDKEQLVINKELTTAQKIKILAQELRGRVDLENLYLVPALREVIENASSLE